MKFNLDTKRYKDPFDHWIINDFLDVDTARQASKEFIDYDNPTEEIIHYQGWIAEKKACNGIDFHH